MLILENGIFVTMDKARNVYKNAALVIDGHKIVANW